MVDGRIEAYVMTPDGRRLGRLDWLFKDREAVDEAQFVQTKPDLLVARVVRGSSYTDADESSLRHDIIEFVGDSMRIEIEYVDAIPREANGKFRQVISLVDNPLQLANNRGAATV